MKTKKATAKPAKKRVEVENLQEWERGFIAGYNTSRLDTLTGERSWNNWTLPLTDWQQGFVAGQNAWRIEQERRLHELAR